MGKETRSLLDPLGNWIAQTFTISECETIQFRVSVWSTVTWLWGLLHCTTPNSTRALYKGSWDGGSHHFLQLLGKRQGRFQRRNMAGNSPALTEAIKWPFHTKSQRPSIYATDPLRVQNPDVHQARVIPLLEKDVIPLVAEAYEGPQSRRDIRQSKHSPSVTCPYQPSDAFRTQWVLRE